MLETSTQTAIPLDRRSATHGMWPITIDDVFAATDRLSSHLDPTPLRRYALLEAMVGHGIALYVKHENFQPTGSFKIRNGLSLMTTLTPEERKRGVVAASTGNHGQGVAYGGALLGVNVKICVPAGNNPEKNAAMRSYGATVVEEGRDYDEAIQVMLRIAREEGRSIAHSTNDRRIIAGAGTMALEIVRQVGHLDALIVAVGGGSQAVGAMTVAQALAPNLDVYGVAAAGAPAQHDSWQARRRLTTDRVDTFAEGVATRSTYDMTFEALRDGLAGFITLTESEIAGGVRTILGATHHLVEGAGAMGFVALRKLAGRLAGKRVAVVFCGANLDTAMLRRILNEEI